MQLKFLSVLLFVGVCFTQLKFVRPEEQPIDKHEEKFRDSLPVFNNFKDEVNEIARLAIEEAKVNPNVEVIAQAQRQINEITNKIEKIGAHIYTCLSGIEGAFKDLLTKSLHDEIICINNEAIEGVKKIDDAILFATEAYNNVADHPVKLEACGNSWRSYVCKSKEMAFFLTAKMSMFSKIDTKLAECKNLVDGLSERMKTCRTMQVKSATGETGKIVDDLIVCAKQSAEVVLNLLTAENI